MIKSGKRSAQLITKARILLKADTSDAGEGWTDGEIAAALDTSVNTVGSARRQLVEEGFEATLVRKYNPNSARPRIFDGATEAKLIALACSPAPEGFARWSLRGGVRIILAHQRRLEALLDQLSSRAFTASESAGLSVNGYQGIYQESGKRSPEVGTTEPMALACHLQV